VVVGELRRGVAEFARSHGAGDDVIDNIALAVSEAATNAIIHAFVGRQAGHVALTAEAGEGSIPGAGGGRRPRDDAAPGEPGARPGADDDGFDGDPLRHP